MQMRRYHYIALIQTNIQGSAPAKCAEAPRHALFHGLDLASRSGTGAQDWDWLIRSFDGFSCLLYLAWTWRSIVCFSLHGHMRGLADPLFITPLRQDLLACTIRHGRASQVAVAGGMGGLL